MCSHEEIDVSHPEFFGAAKLSGYVPPNKEVLVREVQSLWYVYSYCCPSPRQSSLGYTTS